MPHYYINPRCVSNPDGSHFKLVEVHSSRSSQNKGAR
jgi:hypothetical protein